MWTGSGLTNCSTRCSPLVVDSFCKGSRAGILWPVILSHYHAGPHFLPPLLNSSLIVLPCHWALVLWLTNSHGYTVLIYGRNWASCKSWNIFIDYHKLSNRLCVLGSWLGGIYRLAPLLTSKSIRTPQPESGWMKPVRGSCFTLNQIISLRHQINSNFW